jgi:hypothetical protein
VTITVNPAPVNPAPTPSPGVPSTGLQLWLRADAGTVLNGSTVSVWTDQSPNGANATQASATNQPTLVPAAMNGQPVLRFNGTSSFLTFNLPINGWTGATMILVSANSPGVSGNWNGVDNAALFWNETTSWGATNLSPFQQYVKYRFGTTQPNNLPAYTRPSSIGNAASLTAAIKDGTNESLYVNGTLVLAQSGKLAAISGTQSTGELGAGYNNTYFAGDIAEVLVYNRALSDPERQQVEQYLLAKYGVTQGF